MISGLFLFNLSAYSSHVLAPASVLKRATTPELENSVVKLLEVLRKNGENWISLSESQKEDALLGRVFDLYIKTYSGMGLQFVDDRTDSSMQRRVKQGAAKGFNDFKKDCEKIFLCYNEDKAVVSFIVFKVKPYGLKLSKIGSDGSSQGKKQVVHSLLSMFTVEGIYGEISERVEEIFLDFNPQTQIVRKQIDDESLAILRNIVNGSLPVIRPELAPLLLGKNDVELDFDKIHHGRSLAIADGSKFIRKIMVGKPLLPSSVLKYLYTDVKLLQDSSKNVLSRFCSLFGMEDMVSAIRSYSSDDPFLSEQISKLRFFLGWSIENKILPRNLPYVFDLISLEKDIDYYFLFIAFGEIENSGFGRKHEVSKGILSWLSHEVSAKDISILLRHSPLFHTFLKNLSSDDFLTIAPLIAEGLVSSFHVTHGIDYHDFFWLIEGDVPQWITPLFHFMDIAEVRYRKTHEIRFRYDSPHKSLEMYIKQFGKKIPKGAHFNKMNTSAYLKIRGSDPIEFLERTSGIPKSIAIAS